MTQHHPIFSTTHCDLPPDLPLNLPRDLPRDLPLDSPSDSPLNVPPNMVTRKRGFTLIEILVVIAIIAILAGILLAALSGVQTAAKKTQTMSLMQSFARACDEFSMDHGRYPGILPDSVIDGIQITSTQNAMLELMGGARVMNTQSPSSVVDEYNLFLSNAMVEYLIVDGSTGITWSFAFDESRFGDGPWISGRAYQPYFSPKDGDIEYTTLNPADPTAFKLPALIDAWNTPIIYLRAGRKNGPIIDLASNGFLPQFDLPGLDQFFSDALNTNGSIIGPVISVTPVDKLPWLTLLLAHPTFWEDTGNGAVFSNGTAWGTTRGRFVLISAGPDKVYLEVANEQVHVNQQVNPGNPASSLLDPESGLVTPTMMDSFDDVVVFGGA